MLVQTVYNLLITTLTNNPSLEYIEQVFSGIRYNIDTSTLPCIMVEPVQDNDIDQDMNQFKNVWLDVDIVGVSYNPDQMDLAIVGDLNYKGILDINNDIRACLQASSSLGGNVIDIKLDPTVFEHEDIFNTKYPTRVAVIPTRVLYRQEDGV